MPQADEVVAAWERIVRWLRRNAPVSAEALRPGASDEEIARLNEELGFDIPDVLEVWLRMNNGSTAKDSAKPIPGGGTARLPHRDSIVLPGGMRFLGCEDVARRRSEYLHIAQDIGDDEYWRPSWIPVMEKSDGPYGVILDAQNAPGPPPLLTFDEGDYPTFFLPSLEDFLRPLADLLETGSAPGSVMEHERFTVTDERLRWTN
ncbi:hypothetical protein AQJ46_08980 [Streptomyces canus]|uniref:Knr4/Smi1-like domain-containing protein n=1 Tax=Streptomyces canus TaxID=58343 RepID=A0A117R688_9ACTN|nr:MULTISPECIES: SMI1/KNR4 family protein [Streptomyces]KUN73331.1 hypothetical protein AQJ46_08980 [Streptomyces canus]MDI5903478.1 SMI1/KNR4 family protein [Streptomyces sp. 12257]